MSDDNPLTTTFDSFIENLAGHTTPDKLFLTAGIVELLRHSKSTNTGFALAEFLASLPAVEWSRIPFSVTKTVLSSKYDTMVRKLGVPADAVPSVLLTALCDFLSRIENEQLNEELLQQIIRDWAALAAETTAPPTTEKQPAELFNHWLVKRVFESVNVTDDLLSKLDALIVYFKASIGDDTFGPEIRGLAFDNGTNQYYLLLESGEFLKVPKDYEHLRVVNCDVLFPDVPAVLFLALRVLAKQLEIYAVISAAQTEFIEAGNLGNPTQPLFAATAAAEDIAALEHVFDMSRETAKMGGTDATGPTGATVRFPIPETEYTVVLDANHDMIGPYSTARLVIENESGTETVLMRHEAPRLYSLRGVYSFPLKDKLIALIIIA